MTDSSLKPNVTLTDEVVRPYLEMIRRGALASLVLWAAWMTYAYAPREWDPVGLLVAMSLAGIGIIQFGFFTYEAAKDYVRRRRMHEAPERNTEATDDGWATEAELKAMGMFDASAGVPLGVLDSGQVIYKPSWVNWMMVEGRQRSGKTSARVIAEAALSTFYRYRGDFPNVNVMDFKLEVGPVVAPFLRKMGVEFQCDNPAKKHTDVCPDTAFNRFEGIVQAYYSDDPDRRAFTGQAAEMYMMRIAPPADEKSKEPFFPNNQNRAGKFCLLKLLLTDPGRCSPSGLYQYASNIEQVRADLFEAAESILGDDPVENEMINLARQIVGIIATPRKAHHLGDFLQQVTAELSPYNEIGHLSGRGDYAIAQASDIRTSKKPMVRFFMSPLEYQDSWAIDRALALLNDIISIHLYQDGRPIHFVIDEFPVLKLEDFNKVLSQLGGARATGTIYYQVRAGLIEFLGEDGVKALESQAVGFQYMGFGGSWELCERVSKLCGVVKKREATASVDHDGVTRTDYRNIDVPVISPQDLRKLPLDEQVILIDGISPIKCRKLSVWKIAGLVEHLGKNPLEGAFPKVKPLLKLAISKSGVKEVFVRRTGKKSSAKPKRRSRPFWVHPVSLAWLVLPIALTWAVNTYTFYPVPVPALRTGMAGATCDYLTLDGRYLQSVSCPSTSLVVPVWR